MNKEEETNARVSSIFLVIALLIFAVVMTGCATNPDAKTLIETLEFGEDECGEFQLTGDVDVGSSPLPWFSTKAHMSLDKRKPCAE